jgi:hypothetical protein
VLQFQPTVRVQYFSHALAEILTVASLWGLQHQKTVVVYSINDLTHNPGSLHPYDLAVDLDVLGNVQTDLNSLYAFLRVHMRENYDVVFESNHVHVEYDLHRPNALPVAPTSGSTPL